MKLSHLLTALLFSLVFSSCTSNKNLPYFNTYGIDSSHTYIYQSFEVPIQVGDQLSIIVSALNLQSAVPYNLPLGTKSITVEQDGRILYPQLGLIKAEGLTLSQLRDFFVSRLKSYLTDPVVNIEYVNFKITVLGEVANPGVKLVPDGKVNIVQALAQSGDLTLYAKKYPVMVIRENKGRREFGYVNLYSNSVFSSPYYRLQQNDIVYVQPREDKPSADEQTTSRKLTLYTTILGLVTTIGLLILNLTK
jgi:polysaccharide export outer membrane protein